LQDEQRVNENSFSGRVDFRVNSNWSSYVRVFHDRGKNDEPQGVTGRRLNMTAQPTNAIFNLQGILGGGLINEFKFGYNAAKSTYFGSTQPGFEGILISLSGTVANTGIAGQSGSSGRASPGQLVRINSAGNGRSGTVRSVLADVRRLAQPSHGHAFREAGRRRTHHPDDHRPAGRNHLYLRQHRGLPREHADQRAVLRRSERAEPVPQRRLGPNATSSRSTTSRYAQDEWRVRAERHAELRPPLRLLRAADRSGLTAS
jgi:hypothetical protein